MMNVPDSFRLLTVISIEGKRYVDLGEKIHLICNASGGPRIPEDIDWFKDGDMVSACG